MKDKEDWRAHRYNLKFKKRFPFVYIHKRPETKTEDMK